MREETCVCSPGQIWKPEAAAPWLHDSSCKVTFHTVYVADVTCLQLFVVIGHKHIKMFFFPHLWTWTSKSKWMWQIFSEVFCINVNKRMKHAAVIYSTCWDKKFCVYTCRFVCSFQVCIYGYALSCKMVCVCVCVEVGQRGTHPKCCIFFRVYLCLSVCACFWCLQGISCGSVFLCLSFVSRDSDRAP